MAASKAMEEEDVLPLHMPDEIIDNCRRPIEFKEHYQNSLVWLWIAFISGSIILVVVLCTCGGVDNFIYDVYTGDEAPLHGNLFRPNGVFSGNSSKIVHQPFHLLQPPKYLEVNPDERTAPIVDIRAGPEHVPQLSQLVDEEGNIKGDVGWIVDFAIIGNPKCGTTFLMHWLARNHGTYVHNGEVCSLSRDRPQDLVNMYYDQVSQNGHVATTDDGHRIKGGLKCPKEISTESGLENWNKYFPETKFIVTTRHPVSWFQSFYNYHAYGQYPKPVPHPNELIGACYDNSEYLCTDHCGKEQAGNSKICTNRANFHHSLSRLGKTPMDTPEEMRLLDHGMSTVPHKGKIFLMEISQLFPDHESSKTLREDISDFLDLKYELRPLHERIGTGTHNHKYSDEERRKAFVDLCDDEYKPVREILIEQGKDAAEWIRSYFMKSEDVVVSSRKEFLKLLDKWGEDPCLKVK